MTSRPSVRSRGSYISYDSKDADYKESSYSSKSREMKHSENVRRESSYSSKDGGRPVEKRREEYSSRSVESGKVDHSRESIPSKRLAEKRHKGTYDSREESSSKVNRESYSSKGHENYEMKGKRESFIPSSEREMFMSKRLRDPFPSKEKMAYPQRRDPNFEFFKKEYFPQRSSLSFRGGREFFSSWGFPRGFRGSYSMRGSRPDREQLELTKKLVASVLRGDDSLEERGYKNERSFHSFRGRDREGKSIYMSRDIESRPFKDMRIPSFFGHAGRSEDRSFKYESFPGRFTRDQMYSLHSKMRSLDKYGPIKKRMIDFEHSVPWKRMRLDEGARFNESPKQFYERKERSLIDEDEHYERKAFHLRMKETEDVSSKDRSGRRSSKVEKNDKDDKGGEGKEKEKDDGSGEVKVREGHVKSRISGKLFVDLGCPHCPEHSSLTYSEYRYHLDTKKHKYRIGQLAEKHSIVLRKIRFQQRNEQREIDETWEKDNPHRVDNSLSRYCKLCKLAFKCDGDDEGEGMAIHNSSKLHQVQKRYLNPRCVMCRMIFPSRMVFEYHIASIRHLRMKAMSIEDDPDKKKSLRKREDGEGDLAADNDLANFITMDSVGEDEVGSEHEEITGNLEDLKAAEEEAKEGDEEEEEEEKEEERMAVMRREVVEEEEGPVEVDVVAVSGEDADPDSIEETFGKEFIFTIEASYCRLCDKAIRTDTSLGPEAIDLHCRTALHLQNYHYLQSEEFLSERSDHSEGDYSEGDEVPSQEREELEEEEEPKEKAKPKPKVSLEEERPEPVREDEDVDKLLEDVEEVQHLLQEVGEQFEDDWKKDAKTPVQEEAKSRKGSASTSSKKTPTSRPKRVVDKKKKKIVVKSEDDE